MRCVLPTAPLALAVRFPENQLGDLRGDFLTQPYPPVIEEAASDENDDAIAVVMMCFS